MPSTGSGMLSLILTYLISHPLVLIALLGFVYNLLRPKPVKSNPGQQKAAQEMELQRKRLLEEQSRQRAALDDTEIFRKTAPKSLGMNDEDLDDDGLFTTGRPVVVKSQTSSSNPNQQMTDFQADILAALGMKPDQGSSPQDTLRKQLAQKMGRNAGSTQTSQQPIVKKLTAQQQIIAAREAENPTARDSSGTITSSLKSEMTSKSTNNIVDSNAAVRNTSMQMSLNRTPIPIRSNSSSFGGTNDVVRGMIWSEILGKPKSSRR